MQPSQFASSTMKLGFPARPQITWSLGICSDIEDSRHHGAAAATCTCLSVHTIVEHPNQEGDTLLIGVALIGLTAESVYGGHIQSIITDH